MSLFFLANPFSTKRIFQALRRDHSNGKLVEEREAKLGPPRREIHLGASAFDNEGIGAVHSGLKIVLLLANYTGATITSPDHCSDHGYSFKRYLKLLEPTAKRVRCETPKIDLVLQRPTSECEAFNYTTLSKYDIFSKCNSVVVSQYLNHPPSCLNHSADLVRGITKFSKLPPQCRTNACVLQRGGDVEDKI